MELYQQHKQQEKCEDHGERIIRLEERFKFMEESLKKLETLPSDIHKVHQEVQNQAVESKITYRNYTFMFGAVFVILNFAARFIK